MSHSTEWISLYSLVSSKMLWGHRRKSVEDELKKVTVKHEFAIYKRRRREMGISDSAQPLGSTMAGERWAGNAKGAWGMQKA